MKNTPGSAAFRAPGRASQTRGRRSRMREPLASGLAVLVTVAQLACAPGAPAEVLADLGGYPLCEASAAQIVACAASESGRCLVVGDNEVRDSLFSFPLSAALEPLAPRRTIPLASVLRGTGDGELSDIEALARRTSGELIVVGSHSRNRSCERRKKRRRWLGLTLSGAIARPGEIPLIATAKREPLEAAFGRHPSGLLARVARAVREGEIAAERGDCRAAFNAEGAVVVDGDALWWGLRSPLVDGHAVLLRTDLAARELRFVDARLLSLGGAGVRALEVFAGQVYGLSAEGESEGGRHVLWRFPVEALSHGRSPIEVARLSSAAPNAEGLGVVEGRAIVVTDGDQGSGRCEAPAGFEVLALP